MQDGVIFAADEPLLRAEELQLLGAHSVENAMAAAAAALASGLPRDAVAEGLRSFQGVRHRLERVREVNGVLYVNDSKATNVTSALAGVNAFEGGVRLIAGGRPKGESFEPAPVRRARALRRVLSDRGGRQRPGDGAGAGGRGRRPDLRGGDAGARSGAAAADAKPGEVVLLSPACASFDAFKDFEARGDRFRELVEELR